MSPELITLIGVGIALLTVQISAVGLLVILMIQSEKRINLQISQLRTDMKEGQDQLRTDLNRQHDQLRAEMKEGQDQLRADTKEGQDQLRADTKEGQDQLRADTKEGQDQLRADMNRQYDQLRAEMKESHDQLRADLEQMRLANERQYHALDERVRGLEQGQGRLAGELSGIKDLITHNPSRQ